MLLNRFAHRCWTAGDFVALMVFALVLLFLPETRAGQTLEKPVSHTLALKHMPAHQAEKVLKDVHREKVGPKATIRIAVEERTNSLIVVAVPEVIMEIGKLLQTIDVPTKEAPGLEVALLRLTHIEPNNELEAALRLIFPAKSPGRFVVDKGRRTVIVYATGEAILSVKTLLDQFDVPSRAQETPDLQIRVYWFEDAAKDKTAAKLASEFLEVEAQLQKQGLAQPVLIAQTMTQATLGSKFEVTGQAAMDARRHLVVSGQLVFAGGALRLQVQVTVGEKATTSLKTQVAVQPGQMVVIGRAPTDQTTSAFVVQVTGRAAGSVKVNK